LRNSKRCSAAASFLDTGQIVTMTNSKPWFERMSPTTRRIVFMTGTLLLGLVLLAVFVRGRGSEGDAQAADGDGPAAANPMASMPPMPVDVDTARLSVVTDAVRATGHIEANQTVELRPDESGRVVQLLFREGQYVAARTPLVKIDDAMFRAQRERALADRDLARQQLARVRRLREENAATPADLERAEATARSAEAAVNVIELQLQRTTVRAPFSGVIGQRFVSIGDYVTSASRLLTIQTVDPQRAVLEIPERHAGLLRRGQTVEFTVAAYPGERFTAEVEFVDPVVQANTRTIVVKARAPNRSGRLSAGMFIEARLATSTRASAVVIPEDAVQPLRTANVVWAVVDGQASRRIVQLGARSQGVVEVLSGVNPGELVVVGGLERMAEGMPVAPQLRAVAGG
jgi:membrane fusion protein, multidrug efflux system